MAHLRKVEAPDPGPPGDFAGVKHHCPLAGAGQRAVLQNLPPAHLCIDDLQARWPSGLWLVPRAAMGTGQGLVGTVGTGHGAELHALM